MVHKIAGQIQGVGSVIETMLDTGPKRRRGRVWVERASQGRQSVYSVRYFDPWDGTKRRRTVGASRIEAQQQAAGQRLALAAIAADPGLSSWDGWVTKDLAYMRCYRRPATVDLTERAYNRLTDICNPSHVGAITAAMIEQYAGVRLGRVKAVTVGKELRHLEAGLYRAVARGYLRVNPFQGNRRRLDPKVHPPPVRILTEEQFEALLAAAPRRDWRGILLLAYYGGLRSGEILALELEDVDLAGNFLWVRSTEAHPTKSGTSRSIPLAEPLRAFLVEVLGQRRGPGRVIRWTSLRPGRRDRVSSLSTAFNRLCVKASVVNGAGKAAFSMHDLRRTAISRWIGRGMTFERLKLRAGHEKLETTLRYYAAVDERNQDKEIVEA